MATAELAKQDSGALQALEAAEGAPLAGVDAAACKQLLEVAEAKLKVVRGAACEIELISYSTTKPSVCKHAARLLERHCVGACMRRLQAVYAALPPSTE